MLPRLQAQGLDVERVCRMDPTVDWDRYAVALLRTFWGYYENVDTFRAWLTHLKELGVRLLSDYAVVGWNLDKHCWQEIEAQGYDVIASRFLTPTPGPIFPPCLWCWPPTTSFFKPCVSEGSKNTLAITRANYAALQAGTTRLLTRRAATAWSCPMKLPKA